MLIWLILIPIIASASIGICNFPARGTAIFSGLLSLLIGVWAIVSFDGNPEFWQNFMGHELQFTLAPAMAKVMLLLTILVTFATVVGVHAPKHALGAWYNSALLISAGATGAFMSDNTIAFFAFHELALIPTFVMIGTYGRGDKRTIAWKATVYLGLASMVLLTGIIAVGEYASYSFAELHEIAASGYEIANGKFIALLLIVGFGTLVSLFPFHSWAAPA